jgi:catalase
MDVPAPLPDFAPGSAVGAGVEGSVQPPEVTKSPSLSLMARPGDGALNGRRVALLVHQGVDGAAVRAVHTAVLEAGGVPRLIGHRLGDVQPASGDPMQVEITLETAPGALWDAVVLPDESADRPNLSISGQAVSFVQDLYRHCKPILVLGHSSALLAATGAPGSAEEGGSDPGLFFMDAAGKGSVDADVMSTFITAVGQHRPFDRETDPPMV